jgi:hypothetical protein
MVRATHELTRGKPLQKKIHIFFLFFYFFIFLLKIII